MKDKTIAHIKIKGNEAAVQTMMRLRDVLQDEGVEITLEIKSSELCSKKGGKNEEKHRN